MATDDDFDNSDTEVRERNLEPDRCQFCLGGKGGTLGSENCIEGVWICRSCHELFMDIVEAIARNRVKDVVAEPSDTLLITDGIKRVRDEIDNPREQLATGFGGTVTDLDEALMLQQMAAQNMTICPSCYNTGHGTGGVGYCACPCGTFLRKKLEARAT